MTVMHANFPRMAEPPAPTRPLDDLVRAHPAEVFADDPLDAQLASWAPNATGWCAFAALALLLAVVLAPMAVRWFA